jgi:hypothetical protein
VYDFLVDYRWREPIIYKIFLTITKGPLPTWVKLPDR